MRFKKILLGILFLFSINIIHSYTNISSCQQLNSSYVFDTDREIRLNQNISTSSGNCIEISESVSNFTLNCEGYWILNLDFFSYSIYVDSTQASDIKNNITIKNCNIGGLNNINMENNVNNYFNKFNIINNTMNGFIRIKFTNNSKFLNNTVTYFTSTVFSSISNLNLTIENINFTSFNNGTLTLSPINIRQTQNSVFSNINFNFVRIGFGRAIFEVEASSNNNLFENIRLENVFDNTPSFEFLEVENNIVNNIYYRNPDFTSGIILYNTNNNTLSNSEIIVDDMFSTAIVIRDSTFGFGTGGNNNFLINNTIISNDSNTNMIDIGSPIENNVIYGNIFSNTEFSVVGNNNFSFNGIGNRYLDLNTSDLEVGGEYCINPTNCDFFPLIGALNLNQQTSSSLFPFGSILVTSILLISYLIFG